MSATEAMKPVGFKKLSELIPPNQDYHYFQFSERHPFKFKSTRFELVNAWWLSESSLLAYSDPDFVKERFKTAGLEKVTFFSGRKRNAQAYLASNADYAIVSFRGTEFISFKDVLANLKASPTAWEPGGSVHCGYQGAFTEIWEGKGNIKSHLSQLTTERPGLKIWFTGHSMGGALSVLGASSFGNTHLGGFYTFGAPRFADHAFLNTMKDRGFRFVNNEDIVPRFPAKSLFGYHHVGEPIYFNKKGGLLRQDFKRKSLGFGWRWFWRFFKTNHRKFTDHAPLTYTRLVWNSFIKTLKQDRM